MLKPKQQAKSLDLANDLNFFGKRTRDARLQVAEQVIAELSLKIEPADLVKWLKDNKPANEKPASEKASSKPAADTMIEGSAIANRSGLPVIAGFKFLITSAQNNTAINVPALAQLESIANQVSAQLVILPVYYNTSAFSPAKSDDKRENFDRLVQDRILLTDNWLGDQEVARVCPTANVIPTAKHPVNAAKQISLTELFCIVPSTKQQMITLPSLPDQPIREAWTTGTITQHNYTKTRAGSEAETDHVYGGILIEYGIGGWTATNIAQAPDGTMILFDRVHGFVYGCHRSEDLHSEKPVGIKLGDLHCEVKDQDITDRTLELLSDLRPSMIALDDALHFDVRNHHNIGSIRHVYKNKDRSVHDNLLDVINEITIYARFADVIYITESNHNSAIDTWLNSSNVAANLTFDTKNSKLYHLLQWLVMDAIDQGMDRDALQIALERSDLTNLPALPENVVFGRMDQPYLHNGRDYSQHGHKGANGSQGSHKLIGTLVNVPTTTGHTHSPAISRGGFMLTTGVTASLRQGYNRGGASSWQHSHGIGHANGAGQIYNVNPQNP